MQNPIPFVKEKFEQGKAIIADKAAKAGAACADFIEEHPGLVMPILSGVITVASIIGSAAKNAQEKRDEQCLVEDDITGEKLKTRHPLTNDEILLLGEYMENGVGKGKALKSMKLLK